MRHHAGDEAHHVLVLTDLTGRPAWAGSKRGERRVRTADPEPPPPDVPLTRATVIDAARADGEEPARAWLARLEDADAAADAVDAGLAVLNDALHAYRVAAADPRGGVVLRADALAVRAGYGVGEQVAEGRWEKALSLPAEPRERRLRRQQDRQLALRPQERLAALLSGRDVLLACETLVLRARTDLDAGRSREAAMQAHLGLEAAITELAAWRELADVRDRLGALDGLREPTASAANAALQGGLSPDVAATVRDTIERLESVLRARAASAPF